MESGPQKERLSDESFLRLSKSAPTSNGLTTIDLLVIYLITLPVSSSPRFYDGTGGILSL